MMQIDPIYDKGNGLARIIEWLVWGGQILIQIGSGSVNLMQIKEG